MSICALGADTDPNQLLSFKKVYIAPVEDNVGGVFNDTFVNAYKVVFDKNQRFEIVSSQTAADSVIKTKVEKKSATIDYDVSIYLNPSDDLFYSYKNTITSQATDEEIATAAKKSIKAALKKIPFYGSISGIAGDTLTLDIGSGNGLKEGDVVQIARIEKVKRHPLLKSVLDVEVANVGTAVLESVEATISFAKISKEEAGEKVARSYKITGVEAKRERTTPVENVMPEDGFVASRGKIYGATDARPAVGYIGLGPILGSLTNSVSQNNGALNASGSAFSPGVLLYGELWLTKNWFFDFDFSYVATRITMVDERTSSESIPQSTTTRQYSFDVGYRHLVWNSMKGPTVYVKLGFNSFTFVPPSDGAWVLGNRKYKALRIGLGGSMPFMNKKNQLAMGIALAPSPGYQQSSANVSPDPTQEDNAYMTQFNASYTYEMLDNISFKAIVFLDIYSVEFEGGLINFGKSTSTQKQFGFVPSVQFYF